MLSADKNKKGKNHFNQCIKNTKIAGDFTVYIYTYIYIYVCIYICMRM